MKSTPHGLLKAIPLLFIAILTVTFTAKGQFFQLPGTFLHAGGHNQVFDISPDGKIAVALTDDPDTFHPAFLTTFDPILGTEFDHKSFGFGPIAVRMAQVGNKLRVVVLTSEGGPCKIYLFEVLATQALSQHAIALDALMLREPFALTNPHYLGPDKRARVSLFTLNLILTPLLVVTAEATDSQQVVYQLPVEFVGNVPTFIATVPQQPFLTQIVLKIPEEIVSAGDLQVSITTRNKTSNKVLIAVKP